jgi:hypothetical protein
MAVKVDHLARHRDHLALIDGMIATTEAAIGKHQHEIRRMLAEGGGVVPEVNALRANWEALKRLQADREATLRLIAKHTKR